MFYGQPSAGLPVATAWVDRVEFVPGKSGAAVLDLKPPDYWGSAGLRINGEVGRAYQIEVSTNLVDWNLWSNLIRTDSYPYPLLSVATNQPAGFFRATTR